MLRFLLFLVLVSVTSVLGTSVAAAQSVSDTTHTVRVVLNDGTMHMGVIVAETDDAVTLRSTSGVDYTFRRQQVRAIESMEGVRFLRLDPNRSRLLFAPTARPVEKGAGYIADYEVFVPFVAYGAGSGITLAGGFTLFPFATGQIVYIAPKVSLVETPSGGVAVGILAAGWVGSGDEDLEPVGLGYAVGTMGGEERALSLGIAFGYADGEVSGRPAVMFGGEIQVSNSLKLLSENYWLVSVEEGLLLSGGLRFFGDRVAVDLAFITAPTLLDEGGWPFFPWLGFAYNFGD